MRFRFRGQRWEVHHEDREGLWGECDYAARRITIHTNLTHSRQRKRLEILLHEVIHVVFPEAAEGQVDEAGKVLSRVVWSDGWRRR